MKQNVERMWVSLLNNNVWVKEEYICRNAIKLCICIGMNVALQKLFMSQPVFYSTCSQQIKCYLC